MRSLRFGDVEEGLRVPPIPRSCRVLRVPTQTRWFTALETELRCRTGLQSVTEITPPSFQALEIQAEIPGGINIAFVTFVPNESSTPCNRQHHPVSFIA